MDTGYLASLYGLEDRVAAVTGGAGVLCSAMCQALARAGARVAVLDIAPQAAEQVAASIKAAGGQAMAVSCNVLERSTVEAAAEAVTAAWGQIDILINGAGGNRAQATTSASQPFFDLPPDAVQWVFNLNFLGTLLASQVFGKLMVKRGEGAILNISSMNAFRPLTRIPAYSAAKAAVSNFTQWLAVHMAQEYSPRIRVNAIAPGFFLTEQNRFLMTTESGNLTERGRAVLAHTPAGRFGAPDDLLGVMLWLLSPSASFVTGIVVPVDGGFSAFSGV